jgi:hypothetical protein
MSPSPTSAEWQAAATIYDEINTDPIMRVKALHSLLKEMGLPDDYVTAMQWLIEAVESSANEAERHRREAEQTRVHLAAAIKELENITQRFAKPLIIQPNPQMGNYGRWNPPYKGKP